MKRSASVVWTGGLKDGQGHISTQSGVLTNTPYGFKTRFEEGPGTNPEELIAAAHAGCFSMAFAAPLPLSTSIWWQKSRESIKRFLKRLPIRPKLAALFQNC